MMQKLSRNFFRKEFINKTAKAIKIFNERKKRAGKLPRPKIRRHF
jgi:hypothetical protein